MAAVRICSDGELIAMLQRREEWKEGLTFVTPSESFCQVGTWLYKAGRRLRAHRHIQNRRVVTLTQECVIVLKGTIRVDLYGRDGELCRSEVLRVGDFMVMLGGGHGYEILEDDSRIIECKNGPFISVEMDKEMLA